MSDWTLPVNYTYDAFGYLPGAPKPVWHQTMELSVICVVNFLSLSIIVTRLVIQYQRFKRFRKEEIWMGVAGILLVFPYWTSLIGSNRYGSGLHAWNIPNDWAKPFWMWTWGWFAYYIVISMIKVSVCYSLLEILPFTYKRLRYVVYVLCGVIMSLGIANALIWLFQCQPFLSNWDYSIANTWCINVDYSRYAWAGISVPIDIVLIWIPIAILRKTGLQKHERIALMMVFGMNALGTCATGIGAYGIWLNREPVADIDLSYTETPYLICNVVEIFLYTFGASLTTLSRFFIRRAAAFSSGARSNQSSGFSAFSKMPGRVRRFSFFKGRSQRLMDDMSVGNITALPQRHNHDVEMAMHNRAEHSPHTPNNWEKWHTWETYNELPEGSSPIHTYPDRVGVLPDPPESPPPHSVRPQTPETPQQTMWIDSTQENSDEEKNSIKENVGPPASPLSPLSAKERKHRAIV